MEDAERQLAIDQRTKLQYEAFDRRVKSFLEKVWLERSRWIA